MNIKTIIGVGLVVLGIAVMAYSGISFTTPGKPVDFLGLHFETTVRHFISPLTGAIALVCGILLLMAKRKAA